MPTLALNVISNEPFELNRLLESCKGTLFDEKIVVCAMPEESQEIKDVCEKHNAQYFFFKWCKDFSKARNFAIEQTKSQYIMWNDSDDIIKPQDYNQLQLIKPKLCKQIYLIDYIYNHDADDRPESILPRERIFQNIPSIRFQNRIHETLPSCHLFTWEKLENVCTHHYRRHCNDSGRNLELLKLSYDENPEDPRTQFYYGRDLLASGDNKGIEILEKFIKSGQGSMDDRTNACINLANHYFEKDPKACERICYTGLGINSGYAELHYKLGLLKKKEQPEEAIKYFENCLKCKFGSTLLTQVKDFYTFLPCSELSILYFNKGDYIKSLENNIRSDEAKPNPGLKADRPKIFEALYKKYPQPPKTTKDFELVDIIIPLFNEKNLTSIEQLKQPARIIIADCGSEDLDYLKGITVLGKPKVLRTNNEAYKEGILNSFSRFVVLVNLNNTDPLLDLEKSIELMNSGRVAMVTHFNYLIVARSVLYEVGLDNIPDFYYGYLKQTFRSLNYITYEFNEAT